MKYLVTFKYSSFYEDESENKVVDNHTLEYEAQIEAERSKLPPNRGSTQQIGDNKFITFYSYQGIDKKTHLEIVKIIKILVINKSEK